jgi:DNA invertase Pin-like site-specific DNA recombinase
MAQMVSVFAELERRRIGERTKEALAIRREQGVVLGRPASIPPDIAKRIRGMRHRGMTLQAICDVLNGEHVPTARGGRLWRPTSLRAVLAA